MNSSCRIATVQRPLAGIGIGILSRVSDTFWERHDSRSYKQEARELGESVVLSPDHVAKL